VLLCLCAGLKYYLYSCLCLCGLVAGPTRKALRNGYKLPAEPAGLGDEVRVWPVCMELVCAVGSWYTELGPTP
jgi:hypothetical protein